jgi:REP element-mobilizing transposase RayT
MFLDDQDRRTFLALLREVHGRFSVSTHAFCLMGNHYHLLLHTPAGGLSEAMQFHGAAYARYFNRRHGRDGPLCRGRFRSTVVNDDAHLLQLTRYIHRNPKDIRPPVDLATYRWSSHRTYLAGSGQVGLPGWLDVDLVLAVAGSVASYRSFVTEPQASDGVDQTSLRSAGLAEVIPVDGRRIVPPPAQDGRVLAAVQEAIASPCVVEVNRGRRLTDRATRRLARLAGVAVAASLGASTNEIATTYGFASVSGVRSAVHRSRKRVAADPAYAALLRSVAQHAAALIESSGEVETRRDRPTSTP